MDSWVETLQVSEQVGRVYWGLWKVLFWTVFASWPHDHLPVAVCDVNTSKFFMNHMSSGSQLLGLGWSRLSFRWRLTHPDSLPSEPSSAQEPPDLLVIRLCLELQLTGVVKILPENLRVGHRLEELLQERADVLKEAACPILSAPTLSPNYHTFIILFGYMHSAQIGLARPLVSAELIHTWR